MADKMNPTQRIDKAVRDVRDTGVYQHGGASIEGYTGLQAIALLGILGELRRLNENLEKMQSDSGRSLVVTTINHHE